jgi:hypothetical protein
MRRLCVVLLVLALCAVPATAFARTELLPQWSELWSGGGLQCDGLLHLSWGYALQPGASADDLTVKINDVSVADSGSIILPNDQTYTFYFYWKDDPAITHGPYPFPDDEPYDCEPVVPTRSMTPMYYQVVLTKDGEPACYMAVYDQKDDGSYYLPSVERQQAVCGFVADSAPSGDFVYLDQDGTYWFNGNVWGYFKPKLVDLNIPVAPRHAPLVPVTPVVD